MTPGRFAAAGVASLLAVGVGRSLENRTLVVRLDRNRFMPAEVHARVGDTLRFVNGTGGPHNVAFDKDSISPDARPMIDAAIGPDRIAPMSGPILILEGETFTFVVPRLGAGRYPLFCLPHAGNMRGALIVEP